MGFGHAFVLQDHVAATFGAGLGKSKDGESLVQSRVVLYFKTILLCLSLYRISSYSFLENYSLLNLEIVANSNSCRNISIFYLIN